MTNKSQGSTDSEVAAKVGGLYAAAVIANNVGKSKGERANVLGNTILATIVFFWFRAFYIYPKYVAQWMGVKEIGAIGKLWKIIWPLLVVLSPLLMIKISIVTQDATTLLGITYSKVMMWAFFGVLFFIFVFLPIIIDQKLFKADLVPALSNWLGRIMYFLGFCFFYALIGGALQNSWFAEGLIKKTVSAPASHVESVAVATPEPVAPEAKEEAPSDESASAPVEATASSVQVEAQPVDLSAQIKAQDVTLNQNWKVIKEVATPEKYKEVLKEQRLWLKERDTCTTQACTLDKYQKRNAELEKLAVIMGNAEPSQQ